ncbi:MAG: hypothetical protein QXE31_01870 [Candidatus Woesearchaeota archaeon]
MNNELKKFIEKVYVKNIKNSYTKIFLFVELYYSDNNDYLDKKKLSFYIKEFNSIFWANFDKVVSALRDYKKLENEMIYKIIKNLWINLFPKLVSNLKIIEEKINKNLDINENLNKIRQELNNGALLFQELQQHLYSDNGLLTHEERTKLDS